VTQSGRDPLGMATRLGVLGFLGRESTYGRAMSLVVAGIEDGHVTMVADSRVTYTRDGVVEGCSRNLYLSALPKMVILRPDVVVGVTGDDPHRVIERLVGVRERPVKDVLDHLRCEADARFVVAALSPPRLWDVGDGHIDGPQEAGRKWAGDWAAFEVFQEQMANMAAVVPELSFQMMSSMEYLTLHGVVPSVGGIAMRVVSTENGFYFASGAARVGPNRMELTSVRLEDGDVTMVMSVPAGGDPAGYDFHVLAGVDPTRGAVALFIPQTEKGLVFSQDRPWEPVTMAARTTGQLAAAAVEVGIHLGVLPSPFGGGSFTNFV
jgi:hypothetical protein